MGYNGIGFILVAILSWGIWFGVSSRGKAWFPQKFLRDALLLRMLGSLARYWVIVGVYSGSGDAVRYFHAGSDFADRFWSGDFSVLGYDQWFGGGHWWGTPFMDNLSGLIVSFIGPSISGEFLVFSMMSFLGLYCIALSVQKVTPGIPALNYTRWIWMWPSLWFWPSSVGKEAIITLAMGLVTLGYVGQGRNKWILYLAGLGLAYAIRPHVAAVLALATGTAYWLGTWQKAGKRRILEGVLVAVVTVVVLNGVKAQFGLEEGGLEEMSEFMSWHAGQTLAGGSNIGGVPKGIAGIPLAFVNIWMRPFPWEAHNVMAAFSAFEIALFWWIIWRNREGMKYALRNWRTNSLLRFAIPLLIAYTIMIGLTFGNMGIIARQRAPLFAFFFMVIMIVPITVTHPEVMKKRREEYFLRTQRRRVMKF